MFTAVELYYIKVELNVSLLHGRVILMNFFKILFKVHNLRVASKDYLGFKTIYELDGIDAFIYASAIGSIYVIL